MREIDRKATQLYSIPTLILMELAGFGVARIAAKMLQRSHGSRVVVLCGRGNNGGDGFVAARHLLNRGFRVKVYVVGRVVDVKGEARTNLDILKKLVKAIEQILAPDTLGGLKRELKKADLVIDALLGIGLKGKVGEPFLTIIELLNQSDRPILSIDIPSGLDADNGKVMGACVKAARTATMAAPKKGFFRDRARSFTGPVEVVDIGIPRGLL